MNTSGSSSASGPTTATLGLAAAVEQARGEAGDDPLMARIACATLDLIAKLEVTS